VVVISSPGGAKRRATLSRPYEVDRRHHSTTSSSTCLRIAYSGSDVIGSSG